ncbi:MAG: hypothetical protein ACYCT2_09000 [Thermoplasmataceae archaeon]
MDKEQDSDIVNAAVVLLYKYNPHRMYGYFTPKSAIAVLSMVMR